MLATIFRFELRHWVRQPITYAYALVLFGFAFGILALMGGEESGAFSNRMLNSPAALLDIIRRLMLLLLLMLPAVFGGAIYRDWSSRTEGLLYVMPVRKRAYLFAKFGSAFVVFGLLLALLPLGFTLAGVMPWMNPDHLFPFRWATYGQLFGVLLLPSLFIGGGMVFLLVLLTRNIYAGYLAVVGIVILSLLLERLLPEGSGWWRAIFDPLGVSAFRYHANYWTLAERNTQFFPLAGVILWNRAFWLAITGLLLWVGGRRFRMRQAFGGARTGKAEISSPSLPVRSERNLAMPDVLPQFSFSRDVRMVLATAIFYFRRVAGSWLFLTVLLAGVLFLILTLLSVNPRYGTEELPTSWRMIEQPIVFYSGLINAITFLYAGILVCKERQVGTDELLDATPVKNWVVMGGKFLTLVALQGCLLLLLVASGLAVQLVKGFYEFSLGYYFFAVFGVLLVHFVVWAAVAMFVQSLLQRPFLAFFLLLFLPLGFISLGEVASEFLGVHWLHQYWLRFNQGPGDVFGLQYSALDGYGPHLGAYFLYKLYWGCAAVLLLFGALLAWRRGLPSGRDRWRAARARLHGPLLYGLGGVAVVFLMFAGFLYYTENVAQPYFAGPRGAEILRESRAKYAHLRNLPQPRITSVDLDIDLYPENRNFTSHGSYELVNRTGKPLDTLIVNYVAGTQIIYELDRPFSVLSRDTIANLGHFDILLLSDPLPATENVPPAKFSFTVSTPPATTLHYDEYVRENGTYLTDLVFPRLGNWLDYFTHLRQGGEIYQRPLPTDSLGRLRSTVSIDSDRIRLRTRISTSGDQTAIVPGTLMKKYRRNGRNHFEYASQDDRMPHAIAILSGRYDTLKGDWRGIPLTIHHHPGHDRNVHRMLAGMQAALTYCADHFSPYQFDHARIVEFAQTGGSSAHGFPGTIPAGESSCFLAAIGEDHDGSDYAFGTAAHETAHQWWGNQVIPADVRGAKLIVESVTEYVNLRVKEAYEGKPAVQKVMRENMGRYLRMRTSDRVGEQPLIHGYPNQNYLWYLKGPSVLHTLSDYLGEFRLEAALRAYLDSVAYQGAPYTTAPELVGFLRRATPDSLAYLIEDGFERITLYDNALTSWSCISVPDGRFRTRVSGTVRKYYADASGTPGPDLPLADYLEIALQSADGEQVLLKRELFDGANFTKEFFTDERPVRVEIDPYYRFAERERGDNWLEDGN